jgi:D-xylose transport system ATP-binding protein
MEQVCVDTLLSLSVTNLYSVHQSVAELSGGQRQAIAVARAVMWNSKLVILDEPTAALGIAQTQQVLELVKRLSAQGLAVVLISHNLYNIFEVADRITILRLGYNIEEFVASETTQQEVIHAMTVGTPRNVPGTVQE